MAGVPITIVGTITSGDETKQMTITGLAAISGLEVGGGPVVPPSLPPGIWPSPGHPAHPIAPGGPPPIATPPIFYPPFPSHPIVLPPGTPVYPAHPIVLPPNGETPPPDETKPPLIDWKAAWTPSTGWIVVGIPNVPHPTPSDSSAT